MLNNLKVTKSKKSLLLLSVMSLLIVITATYLNSSQNVKAKDTAEQTHERLVAFSKLESQAGKMKKNYGENNTYVDIYLGMEEEMLLGATEEDALNTANDIYMKREALCWYAKQEGYEISDEIVIEMIKKQIVSMKAADNYAEVNVALVEAGTSLEENMMANKEKYKKMYTADKVYQEENKKYLQGKTVMGSGQTDDWGRYWANLSKKILHEYQETKDYGIVKSAVDKAKKHILMKQFKDDELKSLDVSDLLSY